MAQLGNTYTGLLKDIPKYLGPHHMYWAHDKKELYSFEPDHTPFLVFENDNEIDVVQINVADLPVNFTKEDVADYINTMTLDKEGIDTIAVEIIGGDSVGDHYPITWGFISNKPAFFPPEPHTHSYNDLTDVPDTLNGRTDEEIQQIIRNFLVEGSGINIVYDSTENVLRFVVSGTTGEILDQENINIVVNIAREALSSPDDIGLSEYLNNLNPPLLIEGTHNMYFKIADDSGSKQFDYSFDLNLE